MLSEVLSGTPFPKFAQLPFDLDGCIAYTHGHRDQPKLSGSPN
jgi:hypothetical protein